MLGCQSSQVAELLTLRLPCHHRMGPGRASSVSVLCVVTILSINCDCVGAQANSVELPEVPIEARRLFPDPTRAMDTDRMETER